MPINIKELIVRAWVGSQADQEAKDHKKKVAQSANEASTMNTQMLEQLKRMLTDKKER